MSVSDFCASVMEFSAPALIGLSSITVLCRRDGGYVGDYQGRALLVAGAVLALCMTFYCCGGDGLSSYVLMTEFVAGLALFAAVLCAWPSHLALLALMGLVALITALGLCEVSHGARPMAVFANVNHFGCFVATAPPTVMGVTLHYVRLGARCAGALAFLTGSLLFLLAAGNCRTASLVSAFVLLSMASVRLLKLLVTLPTTMNMWRKLRGRTSVLCLSRTDVVIVLATATLAASAMSIGFTNSSKGKSLSTTGRILVWRLAARIASDRWPHGLGFGNYGRMCSVYQADFFSEQCRSVALRMAASHIGSAFSEPLELWAELGVWGLIILVGLAVVILFEAGKLVLWYVRLRDDETPTNLGVSYSIGIIAVGMAFAVMSFLLLSLVHFPRKIMPTFVVFNIALAWVVRVNGKRETQGAPRAQVWTRWLWAVFWGCVCIGACGLTPYHVQRYLAAREWSRAREHARQGACAAALALCEKIHARLVWNGVFCSFHGDMLLVSAEKTNSAATGSIERAIGAAARICSWNRPPTRKLPWFAARQCAKSRKT